MTRLLPTCAIALSITALAGPASAAPTEAAPLKCGATTVLVTGFGRGQVLHVVGEQQRFVVTRAQIGEAVVFDNPGQAGRDDIVECTATSPLSGRAFAFEGFFTPRV